MGQHLINIDELINNTLHPNTVKTRKLSYLDLLKCEERIVAEEQNIRKYLKNYFIHSDSPNKFAHRMSVYQEEITHLTNKVSFYIESGMESDLKIIYFNILNNLNELIQFLQSAYPNYFNENGVLTATQKSIVQKELKYKIGQLKILGEYYGADPELIRIIIFTINDEAMGCGAKSLTFKSASYFQQLLLNLFEALEYGTLKDRTRQLVATLFDFNFNTTLVFRFLSEHYLTQIDKTLNSKERVALLYELKSEISKIIIHYPHLSLFSHYPSLKEMIMVFIYEEIVKCESDRQVSLNFKGTTKPAPNKIWITLSVSQLAYLLRIIYKSNMLKEISFTQLTEFVASNFRTSNAMDISAESLRKKASEKSISVIAKMKDIANLFLKSVIEDNRSKRRFND